MPKQLTEERQDYDTPLDHLPIWKLGFFLAGREFEESVGYIEEVMRWCIWAEDWLADGSRNG